MVVKSKKDSPEYVKSISKFCDSDLDDVLRQSHGTITVLRKDKHLENPTDFVTQLPPEIGLKVLQYLDIPSLLQASRACKRWNNIIVNTEWLWKQFCKNFCEFRIDMEQDRLLGYTWKETLKRNMHYHKIRRGWLDGRFSKIGKVEDIPHNHMTVFDGDTWGDILEAELRR